MKSNRISLCMIVKNEEEMIFQCLKSVENLVDQIIVVDTGSKDRTVDLASAFGAHIIFHDWKDDFSAARNASLKPADGDWVLILDADERLSSEATEKIRQAIDQEHVDCFALPLFDAQSLTLLPDQLETHRHLFKEPFYLHRLFRRTQDLKFRGAIHENVEGWLSKRKSQRLEAPIIHYGNVPEWRARKGKNERNFFLLKKEYEANPNDIKVLAYFLAESFRRDQGPQTMALSDEAWSKFQTAPIRLRMKFLPIATIRVTLQVKGNNNQRGLETLSQIRSWGIEHPHVEWLSGICHENLAAVSLGQERLFHLQSADAAYAACLATAGKPFKSEVTFGVNTWMSQIAKGRISLRLGNSLEAKNYFSGALDHLSRDGFDEERNPDRQQAVLGLIHCHSLTGAFNLALRLLRRERDLPKNDRELLRSEIYERSGHFDDFLTVFSELAKTQPEFVYSEASTCFSELIALINLYRGTFTSGPMTMGTLGAVLKGDIDALVEPVFFDEDRLARIVSYLLTEGSADLLNAWDEPSISLKLPQMKRLVLQLASNGESK